MLHSGIKNEFIAQIHKFMAILTDARYKMQGKTVLYVPNECTNGNPAEAAKCKEYVQRLESMCLSEFRGSIRNT